MDFNIGIQIVITLGILTFALYKDNPYYRVVEALFIGTALSNALVLAFESIRKMSWTPLLEGEIIAIIPIIFGLLWLTKLTKEWDWLSKWSLGIMTGVGAGITMRGWVHGFIVKEFKRQASYFAGAASIGDVTNGLIGLAFGFCFIIYNIFTFRNVEKKPLKDIVDIGRYAQLVVFGIFYASVIMSGWASFGGRIQWLLRALGII